MTKMHIVKKFIIISFVLGLCLYLSIIYIRFYQNTYYQYDGLRSYLGYNLQQYYFVYYKAPNDITQFIDYMDSQDPMVQKRFGVESNEYVIINLSSLNIVIDENDSTLVLYHIGPDGIDDYFENNVIDLDSLTFWDFLFRRNGDIMVSWADMPDICDLGKNTSSFIKDQNIISCEEIDSLRYKVLIPNIQNNIEASKFHSKRASMLFRFSFDDNKWGCELLCNWDSADSAFINYVSKHFIVDLNKTAMQSYSDNFIIPLHFNYTLN